MLLARVQSTGFERALLQEQKRMQPSPTQHLFFRLQADALCFGRFALYMTFAAVAFTRDTVDGVGVLRLKHISIHFSGRVGRHTRRYSLVASCHSLVIVRGGGLAKEWMVKKRTAEMPTPTPAYSMILLHSPGGSSARGP
jgi:hypothetical protein